MNPRFDLMGTLKIGVPESVLVFIEKIILFTSLHVLYNLSEE